MAIIIRREIMNITEWRFNNIKWFFNICRDTAWARMRKPNGRRENSLRRFQKRFVERVYGA
jgi:hypothetical protein